MAENTQQLAEQIALLLQSNHDSGGDNDIRSSLEKINLRLNNIESKIDFQKPQTKDQSPQPSHPSQIKFKNLEEIADEIIANLQNEKACPYEPTGKACDHCSMCNSLGF